MTRVQRPSYTRFGCDMLSTLDGRHNWSNTRLHCRHRVLHFCTQWHNLKAFFVAESRRLTSLTLNILEQPTLPSPYRFKHVSHLLPLPTLLSCSLGPLTGSSFLSRAGLIPGAGHCTNHFRFSWKLSHFQCSKKKDLREWSLHFP